MSSTYSTLIAAPRPVQVLIGMLFGVILRFALPTSIADFAAFNNNAFVLLLLPVIMFHSGFTGDRRLFQTNFWSILLFVVFGTLFSAVVRRAVCHIDRS
jgi:NhaP-type Na+/H+ or K+/H+ antiporter